MFETLNNSIVAMMDYVLGWLLYLPSDAALILVAVATSAILTFVRLFSTDQDWLKRAAADGKRLRELEREAKKAGDPEAVKRYKATAALIKLRSLKFETKPLLYAILPIALLATWCFGRLGFHPPAACDTVEVRAYLPASAVGRPIHIVPMDGVTAETGWVQKVVEDRPPTNESRWERLDDRISSAMGLKPPPEAVATWRLRGSGTHSEYVLRLRYDGRTYERPLEVGTRTYAPPATFYEDAPVRAVELVMRPVKLAGIVGGIDFLFLPPWLVAYLLIAIPFVSLLKRVFRIA